MEKQKNTNYWNNVMGVMIIVVILGELLLGFQDTPNIARLTKVIYLFHMPVFAFAFGFLSKNDNENHIKKYLILYFIGNTITMWLSYILNKTALNLLVPYSTYWLFLAFIVWKYGMKYLKSVKLLLPFSVIIALLIGFFPEVNNVLALSSIIGFFPFFLLGYLLNNDFVNAFLQKRSKIMWILGLVLLLASAYVLIKLSSKVSLNMLLLNPYQNNQELIYRFYMYVVSLMVIFGGLLVAPKFKIPLLSNWGKNYLSILTYYVPFVLMALELIPIVDKSIFYLTVSSITTIIICLLIGNDKIKELTTKGYNKINNAFRSKKNYIFTTSILILIVLTLGIPFLKEKIFTAEPKDILYQTMSNTEVEKVKDSVSILFSGDLILLKEQVRRGYNSELQKYDFNSVFEYTKKYIENADLAIGVFEGPMAGEEVGYTTSDYADGTELHLSFPDEFGVAVKNAGYDLVTLANNHILDMGRDAANRTIDVLDSIHLEHVGAYKNNEREPVIIEKEGLKIGVLAYTYGFNYYNETEALKENIAPLLVDKKSVNFEKVKKQVEEDFKNLKSYNPDVIIVMPHMGTQFSNEKDDFQKTWDEIFIENGANIILGDHTHSVQPIEYVKNSSGGGVTAIIVNSPGNFVNSYQEYYGDATAMVEIYLDKNDASIIGSSVIPMWTNSPANGNYQAMPIYEIMNNEDIKNRISNNDLSRINDVYGLITNVMLGTKLSLNNVEEKLYLTEDGYKRKKVEALEITDTQKESQLYHYIDSSNSILFIGDSITEGTKNGGYPWYEPIMNNFTNKEVINVSKGAYTVKQITDKYNKEQADLYIIAIGTNDVRYRDKKICAMDERAYINALEKLIDKIPNKNEAKFVFIAPWLSMNNDTMIKDQELKNILMEKYANTLKEFCEKNNYLFINPNKELEDILTKDVTRNYLVDYIHPNSSKGIYLYSNAVLNASK